MEHEVRPRDLRFSVIKDAFRDEIGDILLLQCLYDVEDIIEDALESYWVIEGEKNRSIFTGRCDIDGLGAAFTEFRISAALLEMFFRLFAGSLNVSVDRDRKLPRGVLGGSEVMIVYHTEKEALLLQVFDILVLLMNISVSSQAIYICVGNGESRCCAGGDGVVEYGGLTALFSMVIVTYLIAINRRLNESGFIVRCQKIKIAWMKSIIIVKAHIDESGCGKPFRNGGVKGGICFHRN
jgi:hypothetical protein